MADVLQRTRSTTWARTSTVEEVRIKRVNERHSYPVRFVTKDVVVGLAGDFECVIDLDKLLGPIVQKAALNKSGKATYARGAVKVKRLNARVLGETLREHPVPAGHVVVD